MCGSSSVLVAPPAVGRNAMSGGRRVPGSHAKGGSWHDPNAGHYHTPFRSRRNCRRHIHCRDAGPRHIARNGLLGKQASRSQKAEGAEAREGSPPRVDSRPAKRRARPREAKSTSLRAPAASSPEQGQDPGPTVSRLVDGMHDRQRQSRHTAGPASRQRPPARCRELARPRLLGAAAANPRSR